VEASKQEREWFGSSFFASKLVVVVVVVDLSLNFLCGSKQARKRVDKPAQGLPGRGCWKT
jgi:hypothetical protein